MFFKRNDKLTLKLKCHPLMTSHILRSLYTNIFCKCRTIVTHIYVIYWQTILCLIVFCFRLNLFVGHHVFLANRSCEDFSYHYWPLDQCHLRLDIWGKSKQRVSGPTPNPWRHPARSRHHSCRKNSDPENQGRRIIRYIHQENRRSEQPCQLHGWQQVCLFSSFRSFNADMSNWRPRWSTLRPLT